MEAVIEGWVNYFRIARAKMGDANLDELVRLRLRIGIWKQWKTPKTRVSNLRKLGANSRNAYEWGNSSWGYCRMAHSPVTAEHGNQPMVPKVRICGIRTLLLLENDPPGETILTNRRIRTRTYGGVRGQVAN